MFNFISKTADSKNELHFKVLSIVLFATFFIGVFVTRGHALVASLAFAALLMFIPDSRKLPKISLIQYGFFALFSIIALATSTLFSPDKLYALGSAAATIGFFVIGLYFWDYAKKISSAEANKLYDYSRIAIRISSVFLTAILTIPALLFILHPSQVAESVMNRTVVAHVLLSGIFILASMRRKHTADAWIIYIWATGLAFISQSETAKLVCVIAPLTYMFFRYLGAFGRIAACAGIFAYSMAVPWIAGSFFAFIKTLPTSSATFRGAFGARAEIWDGVAQMVQRQPLTGYGFESMRLIKDLPIAGIFWLERAIAHPHNMALQVWADMGLTGAIIVALAFCAIIWSTRKLNPIEATATSSFVIMVFLICQISHGAWQNWWLGVMALCAFFVQILIIKPISSAATIKTVPINETIAQNIGVVDVVQPSMIEIEDQSEQLCMLEQLDLTIEKVEALPLPEPQKIEAETVIVETVVETVNVKKATKAKKTPKSLDAPQKLPVNKKPKAPTKPRVSKKTKPNDDASKIAAE